MTEISVVFPQPAGRRASSARRCDVQVDAAQRGDLRRAGAVRLGHARRTSAPAMSVETLSMRLALEHDRRLEPA